MPDETPITEQSPIESSTTVLVEPSGEALSKLETENAELRGKLEEAEKQAQNFQQAAVKMMNQPAPAASAQVDEFTALAADFEKDGLNDVAAKALARRILDREAKLAERFVPRDQYAKDSVAVAEIQVDALSRLEIDRLTEEGFASADAKKANDWVQKERKAGHYFHSARDAFNLAVVELNISKKDSSGEDEPVSDVKAQKLAKQAQGNMHGAARGGGNSQAPVKPPAEIDTIKDSAEKLAAMDTWVKSLTPEQKKRVVWR